MHIATIEGEIRKTGGHHANHRLRKRGLIPAVVYGHGEEPETLALSRHDLEQALEHALHVIKVSIDGQETQYLLKDVQYDHLQQYLIHADLMRVNPDERVRIKVGIEFRGEPHGVHEGGDFIAIMTDLDIECPLSDIPEMLKIKVDHLGVGETLHVKEIEFPHGVTTYHRPDDVVATVRSKRGVTAEAVAEAEDETVEDSAGGEPEIIGRGPRESEGEA